MKAFFGKFLPWALLLTFILPLGLCFASCAPQEQPLPPAPPPVEDTEPPAQDDGYADKQNEVTDYLNVFGRTPVVNGGLAMFWTNSGFSFAFRGTGVTAKIETDSVNQTYLGYLNVYVDGQALPSTTLCIEKNGTYTLAEGLPQGDHTIEVRKRNEAAYGDSATLMLRALQVTDGAFCKTPPPTPEYVIEFIGDSITSGFGNMVTDGGGSGANFSTHTEDGTQTYATMTARAVDADAQVLSRSGICYVTGTDRESIYPYYIQTAALPGKSADTGYYDFEAHPVDMVIINLGTNDTGARIEGRALSDEQYTTLALDFLRLIRANNPDATIVWVYGMITHSRGNCIEQAVEQFNATDGGNALYCPLPTMDRNTEGVGVHGHPTELSHLISAMALTAFLEDNTFLMADYRPLLHDALHVAAQYLPAQDETLCAATALAQGVPSSSEAADAIEQLIDACRTAFAAH